MHNHDRRDGVEASEDLDPYMLLQAVKACCATLMCALDSRGSVQGFIGCSAVPAADVDDVHAKRAIGEGDAGILGTFM